MIKWLRSLSKRLLIILNIISVLALFTAYLSTHISPSQILFPALFGVAYGIILVINLSFIAFWLFVKKRLALLSAIAILFGINHLSAYFQLFPSFSDPSESVKSVHVLSYNVKLFSWYNWRKNKNDRDEMIAGLKTSDADVLCFQEYFNHTNSSVFGTKNLLKRNLGTKYVHDVYTKTINGEQQYGIATMSKYPIVNRGRVWFKSEDSNICIFTDLRINGDTIRVYNAHVASIRFSDGDHHFVEKLKDPENPEKPDLKAGMSIINRLGRAYRKRASQVGSIKEHILSSPYPVILCGDFNDTPVSYSYAQISSILSDSFRESGWGIGNTYIGNFPSFRIDYIFHSPEMSGYSYTTHPEKVSDHHAISTVLAWE